MTTPRRLRRRPGTAESTAAQGSRTASAPANAHAAAVRLLARRELSEAQLRDRLSGSFEPDQVDAALAQLKQSGAVNDRRVAAAHARTAIVVKRRGRLRVERELEAMGIDRGLARHAIEAALQDVDEKAVLDRELERRLKGRTLDPRTRARLYAQLLRQGFPAELVLAALGRHRAAPDED